MHGNREKSAAHENCLLFSPEGLSHHYRSLSNSTAEKKNNVDRDRVCGDERNVARKNDTALIEENSELRIYSHIIVIPRELRQHAKLPPTGFGGAGGKGLQSKMLFFVS